MAPKKNESFYMRSKCHMAPWFLKVCSKGKASLVCCVCEEPAGKSVSVKYTGKKPACDLCDGTEAHAKKRAHD